jgi:hypothetical protein
LHIAAEFRHTVSLGARNVGVFPKPAPVSVSAATFTPDPHNCLYQMQLTVFQRDTS